jgi:hypothetical protein
MLSLHQEVMAEAAAAAGLGVSSGFDEEPEASASSSGSGGKVEVPQVNNLGTIIGQKRKTEIAAEVEDQSAKKAREQS